MFCVAFVVFGNVVCVVDDQHLNLVLLLCLMFSCVWCRRRLRGGVAIVIGLGVCTVFIELSLLMWWLCVIVGGAIGDGVVHAGHVDHCGLVVFVVVCHGQ